MTGRLDKVTDPDGDNHEFDCLLIDRYPDVAPECSAMALRSTIESTFCTESLRGKADRPGRLIPDAIASG